MDRENQRSTEKWKMDRENQRDERRSEKRTGRIREMNGEEENGQGE